MVSRRLAELCPGSRVCARGHTSQAVCQEVHAWTALNPPVGPSQEENPQKRPTIVLYLSPLSPHIRGEVCVCVSVCV